MPSPPSIPSARFSSSRRLASQPGGRWEGWPEGWPGAQSPPSVPRRGASTHGSTPPRGLPLPPRPRPFTLHLQRRLPCRCITTCATPTRRTASPVIASPRSGSFSSGRSPWRCSFPPARCCWISPPTGFQNAYNHFWRILTTSLSWARLWFALLLFSLVAFAGFKVYGRFSLPKRMRPPIRVVYGTLRFMFLGAILSAAATFISYFSAAFAGIYSKPVRQTAD